MSASRSSEAEYMKIRRYVLNMVTKAGEESIQLPTALELSKQFGVCRQTVGKALKQLAEDRFVIGKPGLGTFTNPKMRFHVHSQKKSLTIGIIIGDGMVIEMDEYLAKLVASCLVEAATFPAYVRTINLTSAQPELVLKELRNEFLDGLIWQNPPPRFLPMLEKLREEGCAVTVIGSLRGESLCSVDFDLWSMGYEVGKLLAGAGKQEIVFLRNDPPWSRSADGLQQAFREAGVPLNERLFLAGDEALERLTVIFELGLPMDALFNSLYSYESLSEIAAQTGYDWSRMLHICWDCVAKDFPMFRGIAYSFDFAMLARRAVSLLRRQMEEKDFECRHEQVPISLTVRMEDGESLSGTSPGGNGAERF